MRSFLVAAVIAPLVAAHGHVETVVADGKTYQGWNAAFSYQNPIPQTVGWRADNLDNGFVSPDAFGTSDIACHKKATNGGAFVQTKAGGKITLKWDTWPVSHKGPVIDYIAPFGESASSLQFTKIAQSGLLSGSNPGTWGTDTLIGKSNSWDVTIPSNLAPGKYVIRHEIIALHAAQSANGAQAYPQCINIEVTSGGSAKPSGGVSGSSLYKSNDAGIIFNIYGSFSSYQIPGPAVRSVSKRDHARDFQ